MSVGAVSEAVRELVHEQLVDFEPNYGARVKRFDAETVRGQHILRIAIECEAIRRCTDRITGRELAELDALAREVDRLVDVEEDLSEARRRDLEFHLRIADLSGTRRWPACSARATSSGSWPWRRRRAARRSRSRTGRTSSWSRRSEAATPTRPSGRCATTASARSLLQQRRALGIDGLLTGNGFGSEAIP